MNFHHRQRRNIPTLKLLIDRKEIKQCFEFKFLGLTITNNLDWSKHINRISNKISQTIGIMSRIKRYVPRGALLHIYNSLILSRIYYCILLWGFDSRRLEKLQKKAIRVICNSKYNAHTSPLFQDLRLLKIKNIFEIQCAKFFYKFEHNTLPGYFDSFFQTNANIHHHNTRPTSTPISLTQYREMHPLSYTKLHQQSSGQYQIEIRNPLPKRSDSIYERPHH